MHYRFFLSDPKGDIELRPQDLQQPFRVTPVENHPFLTLADYFAALVELLEMQSGSYLRSVLDKLGPQCSGIPEEISAIRICSEKHGAFYHIASVTLSGLATQCKFAVTTALSGQATSCLREEYTILQELARIRPDYLPELYGSASVIRGNDGGTEEFFMVLGEWLDDYHEWHVSLDQESGEQKIRLWDYDHGFRFLSAAKSCAMLRHVACVLTLYYDQKTYRQIYPWHHGAGDFVVKAEQGAVAVKLITARGYEPLVDCRRGNAVDPIVAAIHFLLNLTLKIRLDRNDGVGEPAWLDGFAVEAAVAGFFDGLAGAEATGRLMVGPIDNFLQIVQSFDVGELYEMYLLLLELYVEEDQNDLALMRTRLQEHVGQLHEALQHFVPQEV